MASSLRVAPTGRRVRAPDFDAREHLLDAATTLFAERGIANTTIAQIAAASGVTSAMVHYWFQTRDRLLDAVVEERISRAILAVWDPVDPVVDAPLAQTEGIVRRMFDVTERMPWLPSLWLREIVNEGGLLRERALPRIPLKKVLGFGQSIAGGKARGELNASIDPLLLFNSIIALVMLPQATSKIWQRLQLSASFDRVNLERHVTALLVHGLCGNRSPAASVVPRSRTQSAPARRPKRKTP